MSFLNIFATLLLFFTEENVADFAEPLVDLLAILINWRLKRQLLPKNIQLLGIDGDFVRALRIELNKLEPLRYLVAMRIQAVNDLSLWVIFEVNLSCVDLCGHFSHVGGEV